MEQPTANMDPWARRNTRHPSLVSPPPSRRPGLRSLLTCPPPVSDPPRLGAHLPGLLQGVPHRHQEAAAQSVGDHQAPALEEQAPRGQPSQEFFTGLHGPSCHLSARPSHGLWTDRPSAAFIWATRSVPQPMSEEREPQTEAGKQDNTACSHKQT